MLHQDPRETSDGLLLSSHTDIQRVSSAENDDFQGPVDSSSTRETTESSDDQLTRSHTDNQRVSSPAYDDVQGPVDTHTAHLEHDRDHQRGPYRDPVRYREDYRHREHQTSRLSATYCDRSSIRHREPTDTRTSYYERHHTEDH